MKMAARRIYLPVVAASCAVLLWAGVSTAAPTSFDGTWSVSVETTSGSCDRSFRFPIQIGKGRVFSRDVSGVSGRVNRRGSVQVSIRMGDRSAIGAGRLSGGTGAGSWSGRSPSGRCIGQWQAQRG